MMPSAVQRGRSGDSALLTLAWYAAVLVVVFTVAFWLGRTLGSPALDPGPRPDAPHTPMTEH